jgi:hypothetical protein
MRIEKFEVEEKDNRIHVFVQIPHSSQNRKIERFRCKTEDVLTILIEKGVEVGDCVSSTELKNWRDYSRKGTWVFEKKVEKVLDPEPEPTILIEEKPVRTRKRRTRSSTTKVSTEE